jgi:hypothetical protein
MQGYTCIRCQFNADHATTVVLITITWYGLHVSGIGSKYTVL